MFQKLYVVRKNKRNVRMLFCNQQLLRLGFLLTVRSSNPSTRTENVRSFARYIRPTRARKNRTNKPLLVAKGGGTLGIYHQSCDCHIAALRCGSDVMSLAGGAPAGYGVADVMCAGMASPRRRDGCMKDVALMCLPCA